MGSGPSREQPAGPVPAGSWPNDNRARYWGVQRRISAFLSRPILRSRSDREYEDPLLSWGRSRPARPSDLATDRSVPSGRRSRLSRPRSSFANLFPHDSNGDALSSRPTSRPPDLHLPDLDLGWHVPLPDVTDVRTPSERERPSTLSDRITSLRPDLGLRNISASLRRRRSTFPRTEDQAAMLSRLLSVAAAATAASLMGDNPRTAVSEMRHSGSIAPGEDGTFNGFLQSLQNGQLANALRQSEADGANDAEGGDGSPAPLNFFRMFRFGSSTNDRQADTSTSRPTSSPGEEDSQEDQPNRGQEQESDGRMIPVLIVGIRSMSPDTGNGPTIDNPFLDALSNLPSPSSPGEDETTSAMLDGMLRQPRSARLGYRRRSSMNGFNMFSGANDSQRRRRSPEFTRSLSETVPPSSMESPPGPHPPPSTPAEPGLSALSSGTSTPNRRASTPSTGRYSTTPPRPESMLPRAGGTTLEATAEEPSNSSRSGRSGHSNESDFTPRFGSGNPRRNGVVEPDSAPGDGSRSWIIYVLGGTYPENHPILTTPSLFTDSPTYEDMLLLSSLLGPAKPPVATAEDIAIAPGLFKMRETDSGLVAMSVDGQESIAIAPAERCLICLCNYQVDEEARSLVKCNHLYHRECIDEWLTTGRNSCPLCRGQGVPENAKEEGAADATAASSADVDSPA